MAEMYPYIEVALSQADKEHQDALSTLTQLQTQLQDNHKKISMLVAELQQTQQQAETYARTIPQVERLRLRTDQKLRQLREHAERVSKELAAERRVQAYLEELQKDDEDGEQRLKNYLSEVMRRDAEGYGDSDTESESEWSVLDQSMGTLKRSICRVRLSTLPTPSDAIQAALNSSVLSPESSPSTRIRGMTDNVESVGNDSPGVGGTTEPAGPSAPRPTEPCLSPAATKVASGCETILEHREGESTSDSVATTSIPPVEKPGSLLRPEEPEQSQVLPTVASLDPSAPPTPQKICPHVPREAAESQSDPEQTYEDSSTEAAGLVGPSAATSPDHDNRPISPDSSPEHDVVAEQNNEEEMPPESQNSLGLCLLQQEVPASSDPPVSQVAHSYPPAGSPHDPTAPLPAEIPAHHPPVTPQRCRPTREEFFRNTAEWELYKRETSRQGGLIIPSPARSTVQV